MGRRYRMGDTSGVSRRASIFSLGSVPVLLCLTEGVPLYSHFDFRRRDVTVAITRMSLNGHGEKLFASLLLAACAARTLGISADSKGRAMANLIRCSEKRTLRRASSRLSHTGWRELPSEFRTR
jgi:hypothetical protein